MVTEFAITNDLGQFTGVPTTTYTSADAARTALSFINTRRDAMQRDAQVAQEALKDPSITSQDRQFLQGLIDMWEENAPRSHWIVRREVGPWKKVEG